LRRRRQKMSNENGAENGYQWWLQYILIPVGVAVIAGSFALSVALMAGLRQQAIAGLEVTRDFEILATQLAVTNESSPENALALENGDGSGVEPAALPATATLTSAPPPTPIISPTMTPEVSCGQVPAGWRPYLVVPGDTLYSLARQSGTTVTTIQQVNCMASNQIIDGQRIWLPAMPPTEPPTVPTTETPRPSGDVMVVRAWTADSNLNPKTTFEPGDPIQWVLMVENATGRDAEVELTYEVSDASGGLVRLWNGTVTTGTGTRQWNLSRTVLPDTAGTGTFSGSGSYNGTPSKASATYFVTVPTVTPSLTPTAQAACNLSFAITNVRPNETVTFQTNNYPRLQTFTVTMGPMGTKGINGIVVGQFNSGHGGSFAVSMQIPAQLAGSREISIRTQTENPDSALCAHSWFENVGDSTLTPTPTSTSTATSTPTATWTPSPTAVGSPDLIVSDVSSISVSCPGGSGTCVTEATFVVANEGIGSAGAFNILITADPSQSVTVNQLSNGLASGETQTLTILTTPGGNCFDPDCTVCVTVDSGQAITESNEGNNLMCQTRGG
jgi:hypothetical protein